MCSFDVFFLYIPQCLVIYFYETLFKIIFKFFNCKCCIWKCVCKMPAISGLCVPRKPTNTPLITTIISRHTKSIDTIKTDLCDKKFCCVNASCTWWVAYHCTKSINKIKYDIYSGCYIQIQTHRWHGSVMVCYDRTLFTVCEEAYTPVTGSHIWMNQINGILPTGPYPPCLRMADRALLAGYPRNMGSTQLPWVDCSYMPDFYWEIQWL